MLLNNYCGFVQPRALSFPVQPITQTSFKSSHPVGERGSMTIKTSIMAGIWVELKPAYHRSPGCIAQSTCDALCYFNLNSSEPSPRVNPFNHSLIRISETRPCTHSKSIALFTCGTSEASPWPVFSGSYQGFHSRGASESEVIILDAGATPVTLQTR